MKQEAVYGLVPPCVDCDTGDVGCNFGFMDAPWGALPLHVNSARYLSTPWVEALVSLVFSMFDGSLSCAYEPHTVRVAAGLRFVCGDQEQATVREMWNTVWCVCQTQ